MAGIRRISSGGPYESRIGYCRATVANGMVFVSGTVAGGPDVPTDVVDQCKSALAIIRAALNEAGAGFADVVRVNYILPDVKDFEPCWPLLQATFGENPPATMMIESNLIDPKYKIEIEVTACLPVAQ
jgi:enamine deaminase RidA (YjgF/YER057c/UK114 family)